MSGTGVWYASPTIQDRRAVIRFDRVAFGAQEVLELLREAEEIAHERSARPGAGKLLVFVDEPAKLFADEVYGVQLQERAQSLTRAAGRDNGVRVELEW